MRERADTNANNRRHGDKVSAQECGQVLPCAPEKNPNLCLKSERAPQASC